MPIILVGEAPSSGGAKLPNHHPLDPRTRSGARLARLAGVNDVADVFGVINLVDRWPGRTSRGAAFPTGLARTNAERLWRELPAGTDLILVGVRVASAFGVNVPLLRWETMLVQDESSGFGEHETGLVRRVAVFPHPSGMNRWWNDPRNEARARRFLRAAVRSLG